MLSTINREEDIMVDGQYLIPTRGGMAV
jgi:hypothetical protein